MRDQELIVLDKNNGALQERPDTVRRIHLYRSIGISVAFLLCVVVTDRAKHAEIKNHVNSIFMNLAELDLGVRPKLRI